MAKRRETKPPEEEREAKKSAENSDTPVEETDDASQNSSKLGRKTLAIILSHLERREEKNDEIVQKQSKQTWIITILLVLGLLASIGVASAVKFYGIDLNFGSHKSEKPADTDHH